MFLHRLHSACSHHFVQGNHTILWFVLKRRLKLELVELSLTGYCQAQIVQPHYLLWSQVYVNIISNKTSPRIIAPATPNWICMVFKIFQANTSHPCSCDWDGKPSSTAGPPSTLRFPWASLISSSGVWTSPVWSLSIHWSIFWYSDQNVPFVGVAWWETVHEQFPANEAALPKCNPNKNKL